MSLKFYFKQFRSILGIITGFIGAFPFIGNYLLQQKIPNVIPPVEDYVLVIYVIFFITAVFMVYFLKDLNCWKKPWSTPLTMGILFLIAFVGFSFYGYWSARAIRTIPIPTLGKNVSVIVGLVRTDFAVKHFSNKTDEEMLEERGYTASDIRKLWTQESILRARIFIIASYFSVILLLGIGFSVGVLKSCLEKEKGSVRSRAGSTAF
jgi:hypothetical protein